MPFIDELLIYDSVSIVGLEKNTGKTECLNYLLRRIDSVDKKLAITSVGLDGERIDQVTGTAKPEIFLREGVIFATSEKHFKQNALHAEILDLSESHGSLGRVVTARSITSGKIILSGPSSTSELKEWMETVRFKYRADICIIDGALSRMSQASPAVSSAIILTTGAALSLNINNLVFRSAFVVNLIRLPKTDRVVPEFSEGSSRGIWLFKKDGQFCEIYSGNNPDSISKDILTDAVAVFVGGALTDRLLKKIKGDFNGLDIELIIRDFTRIFASERNVFEFTRDIGKISVLQKSKLVAICVNPLAPNGARLDSTRLCDELRAATGYPVYDIFKDGYEN